MKRTIPEGYRPYVTHFRTFEKPNGERYIADMPTMPCDKLIHKGGITEVALVDRQNSFVGMAFAYCSEQDNYSKKIGRDIATGRLLKALETSRPA